MMKRQFTVYEELMYDDQADGTCAWTGRLYKYSGGVVAEVSHAAPDRNTARESFKEWAATEMQKFKVQDAPELQVITAKDVGVLKL